MDNHIPMFPNIKYISFFFSIIITFSLKKSYSQPIPIPPQPQLQPPSIKDYSTCRDIKNSYNCGHITNISYPFWGQNGDYNCGAGKPFYLNCNKNNITTIELSSQNFTVLDINTTTYTIKLKRTDLSENLCSPQFDSTYLSPTLFQYLSSVNITIFYNCSSKYSSVSRCGPQNPSFCHVGNQDILLEESPELRDCKRHIQVPAWEDFVWPNYYGDTNAGVVDEDY